LIVVDPTKLSQHFDSAAAERKWDEVWQESGVYRYRPGTPRERNFVIDTPPPTVSGSLHVGHVFSYTHTDLLARFHRMAGRNVFYPMGWDDNGLPTERRVQNYFHVRCEPGVHYEPGLSLEMATDERRKAPPKKVSRQNFIELCLQLTVEDEKAFKALWQRLGLSVDWRLEYSTIDERSRRIAQQSFVDLYRDGHVHSMFAPAMWDVDFRTAVAQAEVEDRMVRGAFHDIEFGVEGEERTLTIATTRPELLAACVGVTAHPDDDRYRPLFGKRAVTPLFRVPVPIFPSELADPEKGTGILMVCTFGDQTDVQWWREQELDLRQVVAPDGTLKPVEFGSAGYPSLNPEAANAYYARMAGKPVREAKNHIVAMLAEPGGAAYGSEPPMKEPPKPIEHAVKFFEKGDRPLEFLPTRQWFVRLLDKKERLIELGNQMQWHPGFMGLRFRNWTENLGLDWCISRQRYFGVPFPVWYPLDSRGEPDYDHPILAADSTLPVDPTDAVPPGYTEEQRGQPNGFRAESDVFDTWFTSSMTPQIAIDCEPNRTAKPELFPMDVRPQSHEIIRTWAFYTIAKAMLHEKTVPWTNVAISGWVLDPDRKKMSKSKGNVLTPVHLLDQYGADAVRYWSASARLGSDTAFDEKVLKIGKRLVTKIFNAGKFVLQQTAETGAIAAPLDLAFLARLRQLIGRATRCFEEYDSAVALAETEKFFWSNFTDTYLELSKARSRSETGAAGRASAVATLRLTLDVMLRLFAPFLPYITEEVWSWAFAEEKGAASIHGAPWPSLAELEHIPAPADEDLFPLAVGLLGAINKVKSEKGVSVGRPIESLIVLANPATASRIEPVLNDVAAAVRAVERDLRVKDSLADAEFLVEQAVFATAG
jgi:valyl-tRNA synthetase